MVVVVTKAVGLQNGVPGCFSHCLRPQANGMATADTLFYTYVRGKRSILIAADREDGVLNMPMDEAAPQRHCINFAVGPTES